MGSGCFPDKKTKEKKMKRQTRRTLLFIARAAVIAALYAVLTMVLWSTSSGIIQFRLSEALCVLPAFTTAAIPGLTIGCALANLIAGHPLDAVFGSLATLIAAVFSWMIGRMFGVGKTERLKLGAELLVQ